MKAIRHFFILVFCFGLIGMSSAEVLAIPIEFTLEKVSTVEWHTPTSNDVLLTIKGVSSAGEPGITLGYSGEVSSQVKMMVENCNKLATLVMSYPGKFNLYIKTDSNLSPTPEAGLVPLISLFSKDPYPKTTCRIISPQNSGVQ